MSDILSVLRSNYPLWAMANFLLQSTAIILIAAVATRYLKDNPATRHALWLVTLFFIAAIPFQCLIPIDQFIGTRTPSTLLPLIAAPHIDGDSSQQSVLTSRPAARHVPAPIPIQKATAATEVQPILKPATEAPRYAFAEVATSHSEALTAELNRVKHETLSKVSSTLLYVWYAGIAIGIVRVLHGVTLLTRLIRRSQPCQQSEVLEAARQAAQDSGLRSIPRLLISNDTTMPFTVGLIIPRLILPQGITSFDARELRHMLIHEFAHLRRWDAWVGVFQRTTQIAFWPQVGIRFVTSQLNRAREELCDNVVLRTTNTRAYAETLLSISQKCRIQQVPMFGFAFLSPKWNLETRLNGLLSNQRSRETRAGAAMRTGLGAVAISYSFIGGYIHFLAAPAVAEETQKTQQEEATAQQNSTPLDGPATATTEPVQAITPTPQKAEATRENASTPQVAVDLAKSVPATVERYVSIENLEKLRNRHETSTSQIVLDLLKPHFTPKAYEREVFEKAVADIVGGPFRSLALAYEHGGFILIGHAEEKDALASHPLVKETPSQLNVSVSSDLLRIMNSRITARVRNLSFDQALSDVAEFNEMRNATAISNQDSVLTWFHNHQRIPRRRGNSILRHVDFDGGRIEFAESDDVLSRHRTTTKLDRRLQLPMFLRKPFALPEDWVPSEVKSYGTMHIDFKNSLPMLKSTIDTIVDSEGFCDDVLTSFRTDRNGPQIDVEQQLFAHLADRVSLVTGPYGDTSDWIASIHVSNQPAVEATMQRLMAAEPNKQGPVFFADGLLYEITLEEDASVSTDVPIPAGDQEEQEGIPQLRALAVYDGQLILSSSHDVMTRVLSQHESQTTKRLMTNQVFLSLVQNRLRARNVFNKGIGHSYLLGTDSVLPAFSARMNAIFSDNSEMQPSLEIRWPDAIGTAYTLFEAQNELLVDGAVLRNDEKH